MSAHDLAMTMIREVLYTTGITAKHAAPDKDGVRIAELDEESFRYLLWDHKPLTDFWQTGPGTVRRLEKHGISATTELFERIADKTLTVRRITIAANRVVKDEGSFYNATILPN